MAFEHIESGAFEAPKFDVIDKMKSLQEGFGGGFKSVDGVYADESFSNPAAARWLDMESISLRPEQTATLMDTVKAMKEGIPIDGNKRTLGLDEISNWTKNEAFYNQNLNQHAGFAAEVIGTAKENSKAVIEGSDIRTYRADDRPDLFKKNDQYVDKIRVDGEGNIIERIQTKFVGNDAKGCLDKLRSKKYDKYFEPGKVDKIEVPKEYYKDIMKKGGLLDQEAEKLQKQLERTRADGKTEAAAGIERKLERIDQIRGKLEESMVTKEEARYAATDAKHAARYTKKVFTTQALEAGHETGKNSGLTAAAITAAVSTVDNLQKVAAGEITPQEAFVDVAKDTGTAGVVAYGTGFISGSVSYAMSQSSYKLVNSLSKTGLPAALISVGVDSYDSIMDYAQGQITGSELAYDLGESMASVAGSMGGAALAGATIGSVVPGAGTAVGAVGGAAVGLVGGMVGTAVVSQAYATAVEFASPGAEALAEKAQSLAAGTIEAAREAVPQKVDFLRGAINTFASENGLPIAV